jgi:hypothetical protein
MIYGAIITYPFFMKIDSQDYFDQISQSRHLYMETYNHTLTSQQYSTTMSLSHDLSPSSFNNNINNNINHNRHKIPSFPFSKVQHLIPHTPTPHERMPICFAFMMCLAVGIAVTGLLSFHLYLILTSQTTIEFHGNLFQKRIAKENGNVFVNPYDRGMKRNLEQVWGSIHVKKSNSLLSFYSYCDDIGNGKKHGDDDERRQSNTSSSVIRRMLSLTIYRIKLCGSFLLLLLPSTREPEFLPIPFEDDRGKRQKNNFVAAINNRNRNNGMDSNDSVEDLV